MKFIEIISVMIQVLRVGVFNLAFITSTYDSRNYFFPEGKGKKIVKYILIAIKKKASCIMLFETKRLK